ncbi:MAG: sigma-54-dependent Fis family transcriptional regulator [Bacteroidales bacterium]|nr:sigma-54-dependent Fis family transcriptional regulator [Bacteroidales bacterium]
MSKILVIDDERSIRNTLKEVLEYEDHEVAVAVDGVDGLAQFAAGKFDLVLCDIKMPGMDGVEVLEKIMEQQPDTAVVMISGHGTVDNAVESIKKGAFDFIQKPLDLNRLLITVKNAMDRQHLVTQTKVLKRKVSKTLDMIGESPAMQRVREMIDRVAPTEARVLITGRNGTGKELVARWLHEKSNRASGPFVEVNCAAIPSELIESELFGHEKGSFTSAYKDRRGKFELAIGGTLFLDEIGDMSLSAQAKVLRALQENKITRVGSDKEIKVDVRILAATNKDLKEEIAKKNFREDLYHRLSVILIDVPSLNERLEDIPLLVEHFNGLICSEYGTARKTFTPEAIQALQQINWTGNIRQLHNVVERLIILCGDTITGEDVQRYAQPIAS